MRELVEQVRNLTNELTRQRDVVANLQGQRLQELEAVNRLQASVIADREAKKEKVQFVDIKGIGRPTIFNSDMKAWSSWSFKLGNFLEGVTNGIKDAMEFVQDQEEQLTQENRDEIATVMDDGIDGKNVGRQLCAVLAQS